MKKITYALLIAFASALSLSACTEEQIAPNTDAEGVSAGTVSDKPKAV